jgi:hypothetical protein
MADQRPRVRSASDEQQVKRAALQVEIDRKEFYADLRTVMGSRAGRNVMWRWLEQCGLFESITEQSSAIYVKSGRRDVGLWLLAQLNEVDPELYFTMAREAAKMDANREEPTRSSEEPE